MGEGDRAIVGCAIVIPIGRLQSGSIDLLFVDGPAPQRIGCSTRMIPPTEVIKICDGSSYLISPCIGLLGIGDGEGFCFFCVVSIFVVIPHQCAILCIHNPKKFRNSGGLSHCGKWIATVVHRTIAFSNVRLNDLALGYGPGNRQIGTILGSGPLIVIFILQNSGGLVRTGVGSLQLAALLIAVLGLRARFCQCNLLLPSVSEVFFRGGALDFRLLDGHGNGG